MPHIAFKGIDEVIVAKVSEVLPALLVPVVGGREEDVLVQYDPARFYDKGSLAVNQPVIVQVDTQPRPKETLNQFAMVITESLKKFTDKSIDVFFVCNSIDLYYHNGKPFHTNGELSCT